ncbi:SEC7-like protein, partial [Basidiobolus meristosporus CBS 931.73]
IEKPTWNETRSVIYQGFALQIINSNAVKNRYLLLMNDLLVVAKPVSREASHNYTLNSRFMVKHIIDLSSISFSASREKERQGRKAIEDGKAPSSSRNPMGELHPLIASTVRRFNVNPYEGIMYMIDKGALRADPLSISTFLHKTPELSRKQIGKFLGMPSNHTILNSYLDRFKFAGIRIDDALRVFLASFRLPGDGNVIDYLVGAFARRWHRANTQYVKYDVETAIKLAFFMMALNADLHNRKSPTKVKMDLPDFIERFRAMDANSDIPESTLIEIFQSIRQDKLETALDDRDYQALSIETRFPLDCHLVIDGTSTRLTITIPAADRDLRIKPVGDGLVCDTPMLDFTYTNSLTFTVKATSLGRKCMTFIKLGARSRKYSSIPAWTVIVEPPFMQHTFQIGFPGDSSGQSRKKFMFGVE